MKTSFKLPGRLRYKWVGVATLILCLPTLYQFRRIKPEPAKSVKATSGVPTTSKIKTRGPRLSKLQRLHNLVQHSISRLQNPPDCRRARKLVCNLAQDCGHACQIHQIGVCLFLGLGTNRTVQLSVATREFPKHLYDVTYLPLSVTCGDVTDRDYYNSVAIKGNGTHETTSDIRVVKLTLRGAILPFTRFTPFTIPQELKEAIQGLHNRPNFWWIGEVLAYITRLQPAVEESLTKTKIKLNFKHPIVGVHVRRTDKLLEEAKFHEVSEYMDFVAKWYERRYPDDPDIIKRVYLVSDEPSVYKQALERYPSYQFIMQPENTGYALGDHRLKAKGFNGIAEEIALLSDCDHLVCTFSSNVGRLAFELMLSKSYRSDVRADSLDFDYFYFANRRYQEAIASHRPYIRIVGDLALRRGDKVEIYGKRGTCGSGRCFGRNVWRGSTGRYPSRKVQEYAMPVRYAGFALYKDQ